MQKMKKLFSTLLALALVASLAACGGSSGGSSSSTAGDTSTGDDTAVDPVEVSSDVGSYTWNLGTDSPEDTVTHYYAVNLSEELEKLSGGQMIINVYPNATLGGDVALLESCNDGSVTFVVQTTAPQVNFIDELALFDLPMVYPTIQEFRQVFQNEAFMNTVASFYEGAGYKLMGYADQTFRVMSSNKLVENMSDFSGVKIRTMENTYHMDFWTAVGASPTPMAFAELYTGLQQGTVTAQENPYAVIASNKLYEVQDYVIQTNHLPHILSCIMNLDTYNSLNDAERAILDEAAANATASARAYADVLEAEKISEIEASGTQIIALSDELYNDMRNAAQPVYDKIAGVVGQDLVNAYTGA